VQALASCALASRDSADTYPGRGVLPGGVRAVVVEGGFAVQGDLDAAVHAGGDPDQDVVGVEVAGDAPVQCRAFAGAVPGADGEEVGDDQPGGAGLPGGLQDLVPGR
jgi:hypothetical protein